MANNAATTAWQLSESAATTTSLARVIRLRAAAPTRQLKTAEIVAKTLRRLIVDGDLKDGDFLPTEAELINQFSMSRATVREAVRLLESDGLIEVRRGSRSGARVTIPRAEIIARPAGLLLRLSGATLADIMIARSGIEPAAAKLLAQQGNPHAFDELQAMVADDIPAAWRAGHLTDAVAPFHLRLVELTGNATLSMIAGCCTKSPSDTPPKRYRVGGSSQRRILTDCVGPTVARLISCETAMVISQNRIGGTISTLLGSWY